MLSIIPLAERERSGAETESESVAKPFDLTASPDQPDDTAAGSQESATEYIMGPKQLASLAFVAILVIGLMSAIAYFAGRKNTSPGPPQVTERVIERIVPAAAVTSPASGAQVKVPEESVRPVAAVTAPETKGRAEVTSPQLNEFYLQLGSVEVGVAEIMVEGLRQRGLRAIVGLGINNKVARVLVGPLKTPVEKQTAQKQVEEMGFHPFPRFFTAKDLEQQQIALSPTPAATPQPPAAKP